MKVDIISRETIRPSSPTPSHLRTFKISLLDQLRHVFYVPVIFFYGNHGKIKINQTLNNILRLKNSLSKTLSLFYPLAGRIKDHVSINCNDKGILLLESHVHCLMSDFLRNPNIEILNKFLPCQEISNIDIPVDSAVQLAIQLNIFDCGAIAIGVLVSHKIVDGTTLSSFLHCWAAMTNGCYDKVVYPDLHTAAKLFPPRESFLSDKSLFVESRSMKEGRCITRRFVFDKVAISTLKAKAKVTNKCIPNPTRVEVLSAFIWKHLMATSKELLGSHRPSMLTHTANIRQRMVPSLSEYSTGNIIWTTMAQHNPASTLPRDDQPELHDLVALVRKSFEKINDDYLQRLLGDKGFLETCKFLEHVDDLFSDDQKPEVYAFGSWGSKSGFNEVDFGWGKPIWVSTSVEEASPVFMNLVMLIETTWGEGIEAWVTLDEHEMAILEHDSEFLTFASFNPSVYFPVARL